MPLAFGAKLTYNSLFQQNTPCPDCPPEPSRCSPSAELTAQCTDKCVVIACTDPNHPESVCDGAVTDRHCDSVCQEAVDCTDCHGFEALLQCCEDYHPYNAEPSRPLFQNSSGPDMSWTGSFDDFWCPCNQPSTTLPSKADSSAHTHFDISREPDEFWTRAIQQVPQHHDSFLPAAQAPHKASTPSCLWNSCQGSFPSMDELVGHVNSHLLDSLPPTTHSGHGSISYQPESSTSMTCLWGDCNSSYSSWPEDFDLLAQHLMNDHLGLNTPYPYPAQLPGPSSQQITIPPLPASGLIPQTGMPDIQSPIFETSSSSESRSSTPITKSDTSFEVVECRWKDCGKSFNSCDELTAHINTDHIGGGKAHYECFWDQCTRNGSQGFQSKQKISRHVQSHTGHRPFQCKICHQNFSEAATLQQHIRRHTQEKPYVCDFPGCGKSFAITGALTIHKRTHNGDKPFKCTYCDRGFAESSNLSKHLRTHTGARPYACMEPGCNKTFARPDQLNRHKAVHTKQLRGVARTALQ